MHTLLFRTNALLTFAGTVLVVLCCLVSVTGAPTITAACWAVLCRPARTVGHRIGEIRKGAVPRAGRDWAANYVPSATETLPPVPHPAPDSRLPLSVTPEDP